MIDIHSHILNNLDDGSKSLSESINILKQMEKLGYTDIIFTPHYIIDSKYQVTKQAKEEKLNIIQREIKKNNLNINLYTGNEIYINENLYKFIEKDNLTLAGSNYLLIEFPITGEYNNLYGIIFDLIQRGYKVILAHPERYINVQKNIKILDEYKKVGVLFQSNIGSIYGMYGRNAKKTFKKLLKNNYISFLSTDIHHETFNFDYIKNIRKKLKRYISDEEIDNLLNNNMKKII